LSIVIASGRPSATATNTAINSTALGCAEVSLASITFRLTTAFPDCYSMIRLAGNDGDRNGSQLFKRR
jgi:hypothetical protein